MKRYKMWVMSKDRKHMDLIGETDNVYIYLKTAPKAMIMSWDCVLGTGRMWDNSL